VRERAAKTHENAVNIVASSERGKWRREDLSEIQGVLDLITPAIVALGFES